MSPKDTMHTDIIAAGKRVLGVEAQALEQLAQRLDEDFASVVELLLSVRGRVVVSGMGKSGHIARKMAATFASTGTLAMFVHPGEASHGDLGMITGDDVVVLLSNSGETAELADIIAYTRRYGIPLVGIASRRDSTLLRKADYAIELPRAAEACPNGLAPTTSTTLTLALGDALAVALMEQRRFTPENYRDFHPGGRLGAILSTVGDLMHGGGELPLVTRDTPMAQVLLEITSKNFGLAGVVDDDGGLIGVITDGDLRRNMDRLMDCRADEVMTPEPQTISPDALASEALAQMNREKNITKLFVMAGGSRAPVGIISIHDCLRAGLG